MRLEHLLDGEKTLELVGCVLVVRVDRPAASLRRAHTLDDALDTAQQLFHELRGKGEFRWEDGGGAGNGGGEKGEYG